MCVYYSIQQSEIRNRNGRIERHAENNNDIMIVFYGVAFVRNFFYIIPSKGRTYVERTQCGVYGNRTRDFHTYRTNITTSRVSLCVYVVYEYCAYYYNTIKIITVCFQ